MLSCPWGTEVLSQGVKSLLREADHSATSRAEVKNAWSYSFTSPIHLPGMVLS